MIRARGTRACRYVRMIPGWKRRLARHGFTSRVSPACCSACSSAVVPRRSPPTAVPRPSSRSPAPFAITAGEFKTPFTREYLISVPDLEVADLAAAIDSIAPRYDVGLMGSYALGALASLSLGVFNGEGANAIANRDSAVLWVARATVRPLPVLGLGASGTRDGRDSLRWGLDGTAEYLGAMIRAEYM